jgi:hypothetical protein
MIRTVDVVSAHVRILIWHGSQLAGYLPNTPPQRRYYL